MKPRLMLVEHGDIHVIVEVLAVHPDGQATCRIVRTLEEYWHYKTKAQRYLHRQMQHDSLHYGDHLEIPLFLMRPCKLDTKLRRPPNTGSATADALKSLALMLGLAAIVTLFFIVTGAHN